MYGSAPLNVFLLVLVAIIFVIIFIKRQNMSIGEGFEAPGRTDCAIYYTPKTEECDSVPFDLPDGTPCKLNFRGWGKYPYDKQPPPNLNTTDVGLVNKGAPENWAWCFKEDPSPQTVLDRIGNRGAVHADAIVNDLGDGASYARLKIKDLSYGALKKAYCNEAIVSRPGFSQPVGAMIGFGGTPAFSVHLLSNDGLIRDANADAATILRKLYTLNVNPGDNRLQLVPRNVTAVYYRLRIDPCGRPQVLSEVSKPFNLATIGGKSLDLITPASVNDDLYGDIDTLQDRIQRFANEVEALKLRAQKALTGNGAIINYAPGLIRKIYNANFNFTSVPGVGAGPTYPGIPNKQAMDSVYNEVMQKSGRPKSVDVTTTPYFNRGDPITRLLYVFEGFLNIRTAGYYQFSINSDDAGDFMINNTLVASHYGYHGADDRGTRMKSFYLAKGYHKLFARVHEGAGVETMFLKWRPSLAKDYVNIPESAFYHDSFYNLQKEAIAANLRQQANTYESRIKRINTEMDSITSKSVAFYNSILTTLRPSTTGFADNISNDGRVYIGVGSIPDEVPLTTLVKTAPSPIPERQLMVENVTEISTYQARAPPRINFNNLPTYTIAFWIRIERGHNVWRNILLIGENDWPDRNPGIYIWPDNSARIHFRHNSTRGLNDGLDLDVSPPIGEWFHYAMVMTPKTITLYVNGALAQPPLNMPPGHNFTWGSPNKKLHLGHYAQYGGQYIAGSVLMQKMYYVSGALTADNIADLAAETINNSLGMTNTINATSKLERVEEKFANAEEDDNDGLFDRVTTSGVYPYQVGGKIFNVYVKVIYDEKWLLILNYRRKGNEFPNIAPQEWSKGSFPLFGTEDLNGPSEVGTNTWGHITPDFLSRISPTEFRFYAKSSNAAKSVIHFKTSDPSVSSYATTGRGVFAPLRETKKPGDGGNFTTYQDHTSSLPEKTAHPNCGGYCGVHSQNQGIYALTNHTFWRWGEAHWNIGSGNRWEVDDYTPIHGWYNNTYHSVWVRLTKRPDPRVARVINDIGPKGNMVAWSTRKAGESDRAWATRIWCSMSGECGWGGGIDWVQPNVVGKQTVSYTDLQRPCWAIANYWPYLKNQARNFGCYPNEGFTTQDNTPKVEGFAVGNPSYELGVWNMGPWWNTGFIDKAAKWIWNTPGAAANAPVNINIVFQREIVNNLNVPIAATLHIIVDDWCKVRFNNEAVVRVSGGWWQGSNYPKLALVIKPGKSVLEMMCVNGGGPAGFIYAVVDNVSKNVIIRSDRNTVYL